MTWINVGLFSLGWIAGLGAMWLAAWYDRRQRRD